MNKKIKNQKKPNILKTERNWYNVNARLTWHAVDTNSRIFQPH